MTEKRSVRQAVVLIGPPGCGKTSLGQFITDDFQAAAVETGKLLRQETERESREARELRRYMEKGELVPDETVAGILRKKLDSTDARVILFDGYPRNRGQAESFFGILEDENMELSAVIVLQLPEETVLKRLSGRRLCPSTGEVLNIYYDSEERLSGCDEELVQREDDRPEVVRARLKTYREETDPVIEYLDERVQDRMHRVSGEGAKKEVYRRVKGILQEALR